MPFFEERVKYVKICHQNSQNMKEYVKSPKICKKKPYFFMYLHKMSRSTHYLAIFLQKKSQKKCKSTSNWLKCQKRG